MKHYNNGRVFAEGFVKKLLSLGKAATSKQKEVDVPKVIKPGGVLKGLAKRSQQLDDIMKG